MAKGLAAIEKSQSEDAIKKAQQSKFAAFVVQSKGEEPLEKRRAIVESL